MCKIGDIILVNEFKNEFGKDVGRHPFIVFSTKEGVVHSMQFDMAAVLMGSFKNENHKRKKLSYDVNLEMKKEAGVKRDSYLKANQMYLFQKDNLDYIKLGSVDIDVFLQLKDEIKVLMKNKKVKFIATNLTEELENEIEEPQMSR